MMNHGELIAGLLEAEQEERLHCSQSLENLAYDEKGRHRQVRGSLLKPADPIISLANELLIGEKAREDKNIDPYLF